MGFATPGHALYYFGVCYFSAELFFRGALESLFQLFQPIYEPSGHRLRLSSSTSWGTFCPRSSLDSFRSDTILWSWIPHYSGVEYILDFLLRNSLSDLPKGDDAGYKGLLDH